MILFFLDFGPFTKIIATFFIVFTLTLTWIPIRIWYSFYAFTTVRITADQDPIHDWIRHPDITDTIVLAIPTNNDIDLKLTWYVLLKNLFGQPFSFQQRVS
jgi:hypothetical protein